MAPSRLRGGDVQKGMRTEEGWGLVLWGLGKQVVPSAESLEETRGASGRPTSCYVTCVPKTHSRA